MKIAFVSDAIWPYNKGGKEKRLFDITTRLSSRHDVHVYTMKWWTGSDSIKQYGITLHALCKLYPLYSGKRRSIREGILFGLACLRLYKENWDAIDVDHMPFFPLFTAKLICLLKGKKMIATWQEVWGLTYWKEYLGIFGYVAYFIEYISAKLPNDIIAVSEHTKGKLLHELNIKTKVVTINNGINFSEIQNVTPSKQKSDVIFAGRLLSHKNVDVLIHSIATLRNAHPNIRCLIIGEGPAKIQLEKLATELNLLKNVLFVNFLDDHNKLYALMKSSNVFVLPSTREGFGIVVVEANACGIPVITINYKDNAAKDLISDGENGYLCDLDENEIAKKITSILKNGIDRKAKQICIDSAKKNDWNNIVNMIDGIYTL